MQRPKPGERLNRPFSLVVFDWDGTAVVDRAANAHAVGEQMGHVLDRGACIVVITGTHVGHLADQLAQAGRQWPRARLYAATNRGSEVYAFAENGLPERLWLRQATTEENRQLDLTADTASRILAERIGAPVTVIADRLNRRKIDLIPIPAWANPTKDAIGRLLNAVEHRLRHLPGGLAAAVALVRQQAQASGLTDVRITTDAKHIEFGLTDKGDSMAWILSHLAAALGIPNAEVLMVGDEFGAIGGIPGSDACTMVPEATGATFVSVGVEPEGLPGGVIYLPGGPTRFLALMTDQASRQSAGLPSIYLPTLDATWTVTALGFDPLVEHEVEARLAIANGYLGCRSALAESDNGARPASFVAGIFAAGVSGLPELVVCQDWRKLSLLVAGEPMSLMDGDVLLHQRTLDLRRGVLHRVWRHRSAAGRITRLHEVRWASLADRHCLIQRLFVRPENYVGSLVIVTGLDGQVRNLSGSDHLRSVAVGAQPATSLTMSALGGSPVIAFATARGPEVTIETGPEFVCERIPAEVALGCGYEHQRQVVVYASRDTPGPESAALASVTMPTAACALEAEQAHVGAWASLWREADIRIEGDPTAQQAIRFALYHLFAAANPEDERLSIGARALSGEGYLGHVFWDTEIYVVPVFQHTHPAMARALLMYRYHTLPAARERARSMGYRGALHAWESADTGADITPSQVIGPLGNVIPILTGLMEHHIAADVAFAVWQYWTATGDDAFMQQAGTEIMVEVARFWASRALPGDDGQSHIRHVIGPDEYHVDVDDNAYTNVMAQWVLRRAAEVVRTAAQAWPATWLAIAAQLGWQADEPDQWLAAANTLVTGLDPATGLLEQFAGYFQLTPIELPPLDQRIGPADMLLGPDVVAGSQVIKQADVVMLLHVLWDHFAADARAANFAFYEPRTAHDSTLSPGIYGALAARLGDVDKAKRYFDLTADIDLGSEAHSTADGVHVAALASLWHLIVFGFAGWRLSQNGLALDPRLPPAWAELEVPFRYRTWQTRLRLRAAELDVTIEGTGTFGVHLDGSPARTLAPGSYRAVKRDDRWQWLEAA